LNQHLEKPIKPKQLAEKIVRIVENKEKSIKLLNKQNSTENFKVPGKPAKKIHIKNKIIERLGK
jgi:hypothetical protein